MGGYSGDAGSAYEIIEFLIQTLREQCSSCWRVRREDQTASSLQRVYHLRRWLEPWSRSPEVQSLDEHLKELEKTLG